MCLKDVFFKRKTGHACGMTKRGHFLVNLGHSEDEPLLSSMQGWDRWGGGGG